MAKLLQCPNVWFDKVERWIESVLLIGITFTNIAMNVSYYGILHCQTLVTKRPNFHHYSIKPGFDSVLFTSILVSNLG